MQNKRPVAIITGASRGIGKAIANRLVDEGYVVYGLSRSFETDQSEGLTMLQVDVRDAEALVKAVQTIAAKEGRLDVLVNNAGINVEGSIAAYLPETWDVMFDTNVRAAFLTAKHAIPFLKQSPNANIINISSRIGLNDFAEPHFVAYGATKAALNNFTVGLARELASLNIRVNAVIPTPTKTDLFDKVFTTTEEESLKAKGKLGTPEEVAELVMRLIDDKQRTGNLSLDERVNK